MCVTAVYMSGGWEGERREREAMFHHFFLQGRASTVGCVEECGPPAVCVEQALDQQET